MRKRSQFVPHRRVVWWITGIILLIIIGLLDHYTGYELNLALFYLLPIGIFAWFLSGTLGLIMSAVSTLSCVVADYSSGLIYTSSGILVWNTFIRLGFFIFVSYLLSRVRREYRLNQRSARNDYVTGAASTRFFYDLAQAEVDRISKNRRPFTLAYLDVDNFRQVNDQYGHSAGDHVLHEVVEKIRQHIRSTDIVARMGGDEFAILLLDTDQGIAQQIMERIRKGLAENMRQQGWDVTFSIGVVTFRKPPKTVDEAIRLADQAMYHVKNSTKSNVHYQLVN